MKAPSYEIELKINRIGSSPIYFGATCAGNGYEICRGMIDVTEVFKNKKFAQWASVKIPVSCLQSAGLDSSNMDIRAILLSNDNWDIDLHSIKISIRPFELKIIISNLFEILFTIIFFSTFIRLMGYFLV